MKKWRKESGVSLIETMIAVSLLMIMGAGMTAVFGFCTGTNKSQGELATQTTEYAQDKMEQLMGLPFLDPGLTVGGNTAPGGALAGYSDYVDWQGNASVAGALYTRQWSITANAAGNLKTITVAVYASNAAGGPGAAPSATLVCTKSNNQ